MCCWLPEEHIEFIDSIAKETLKKKRVLKGLKRDAVPVIVYMVWIGMLVLFIYFMNDVFTGLTEFGLHKLKSVNCVPQANILQTSGSPPYIFPKSYSSLEFMKAGVTVALIANSAFSLFVKCNRVFDVPVCFYLFRATLVLAIVSLIVLFMFFNFSYSSYIIVPHPEGDYDIICPRLVSRQDPYHDYFHPPIYTIFPYPNLPSDEPKPRWCSISEPIMSINETICPSKFKSIKSYFSNMNLSMCLTSNDLLNDLLETCYSEYESFYLIGFFYSSFILSFIVGGTLLMSIWVSSSEYKRVSIYRKKYLEDHKEDPICKYTRCCLVLLLRESNNKEDLDEDMTYGDDLKEDESVRKKNNDNNQSSDDGPNEYTGLDHKVTSYTSPSTDVSLLNILSDEKKGKET
jgi:hypothetical protein